MKGILPIFVVAIMIGGRSQSLHAQNSPSSKEVIHNEIAHDGRWWLSADRSERYGFLNGAADCLTWVAHERGFSETPEQLDEKITRYYTAHPKYARTNVIDVWKKLSPVFSSATLPEGEKPGTMPIGI